MSVIFIDRTGFYLNKFAADCNFSAGFFGIADLQNMGSRTNTPEVFPPTISIQIIFYWAIAPGQFPPRKITSGQLPRDHSHLR